MILIWLWTRLSKTGARPEVSGRLLRRFPEAEVARLLKARVLIEDRKVDTWGTCAYCDCGYEARLVEKIDGRLVACCPLDSRQDVLLEPCDLKRYRVDADRLVTAIAAAGRMEDTPAEIAAGIWFLGRSATGRRVFMCRTPKDVFVPGISMLVKSMAGAMPPIVMCEQIDTNSGISLRDMEIDVHEFDEIVRPNEKGDEEISFDALLPPRDRVRLVMDRGRQVATLDGQILDLPLQMIALLRLFAEQALRSDPRLKKQEIEIDTGREAKELMRDLRGALMNCGLTRAQVDELFVSVRGIGYRLALAREEIEIIG